MSSDAPAEPGVQPPPPPPARHSTVVPVMLWVIAAGVMTQAALAGMFLSGVAPGARMTHVWVAFALPYLGLVAAGVATGQRKRANITGGLVAWSWVIAVLLWVQEALGHMPFPVSTAIHVPVGVALFAGALVLAMIASRR